MRIFYAAPDTPHEGALATSRLWRVNLYEPLRDLGHELIEFDFDYSPYNYHLDPDIPEHRQFIAEHRPRFGEELVRQVRRAHRERPIDLFFSYFYGSYVEAEAIREIGRLGIATVNWYCNASYQFRLVEAIAPAYDLCLVPEKFRLDDYRRVGAKPLYCQEAANPNVYRPIDVPHEFDVTFVGQRYGTRPDLLGRLHRAGFDVRAWGPHWPPTEPRHRPLRALGQRVKNWLRGRLPADLPADRCGPPLPDDELIAMYSRSRISLGFSTVAYVPKQGPPIKQVRLRDFEATMSGAFYLVEQFDELEDFFEPDREIVCFRDARELIDKTRFYLAHPAERERIRQAGMRRARAEHTWHARFEMMFRHLGLNKAGRRCAG